MTESMDQDPHVTRCGSGRPLVFVHGWRLDSSTESADFEQVDAVQRWQRIYIDLPGMGGSPVLPELRTLGEYSDWLRHTVPRLTNGQPYAVAATSAGAALALSGWSRTPTADLRGLMCRVPLIGTDEEHRRASTGSLPWWAVDPRSEKRVTLWAPAQERASQHVRDLRAEPARYSIAKPTSPIDVPALVLAGRQDTRVGFEGAASLVSVLPRATVAIVDGAEHEYPHGQRNLFEALVTDWLERVEREWNGSLSANSIR